MEENDDCKRLLKESTDKALAAKGFEKKIVRFGSGFSMSGVALYKKNVLAALRRQMTSDLS